MKENFKQEIYDIVSRHLLTQNSKCLNDEGECCLRNSQGLKCVIGVLIPDNDYNPSMERNIYKYLKSSGYSEDEILFIGSLQEIHDCDQVSEWKDNLLNFAKLHNLNCNSLIIQ